MEVPEEFEEEVVDRFDPLLLGPDEYLLRDYSASLVEGDKGPTPGRLKLCTTALYFVPRDPAGAVFRLSLDEAKAFRPASSGGVAAATRAASMTSASARASSATSTACPADAAGLSRPAGSVGLGVSGPGGSGLGGVASRGSPASTSIASGLVLAEPEIVDDAIEVVGARKVTVARSGRPVPWEREGPESPTALSVVFELPYAEPAEVLPSILEAWGSVRELGELAAGRAMVAACRAEAKARGARGTPCSRVTPLSDQPGFARLVPEGGGAAGAGRARGRDEGGPHRPPGPADVLEFAPLGPSPGARARVRLADVIALSRRTWRVEDVALEVFVTARESLYLAFPTRADRDGFEAALRRSPALTPARLRSPEAWTAGWVRGKINSFDYLCHLNRLAGRSFQDLSQYPIFPWILSDYDNATLDLDDPASYRDLRRPVGALGDPARLRGAHERYRELAAAGEPDVPAFHWGCHYSTPAYVAFWLMRAEPGLMLKLQGGRFDAPDRLFNSVQGAWRSVLSLPADVKELIPEFFATDPSFLVANPADDFGVRQVPHSASGARPAASKRRVGDVALPPWASSPAEFLRLNAQALEHPLASRRLHRWIDLVFGRDARGARAAERDNVFHFLTYDESAAGFLARETDPARREALKLQMVEFGRTPRQLFAGRHPKRLGVSGLARLASACLAPGSSSRLRPDGGGFAPSGRLRRGAAPAPPSGALSPPLAGARSSGPAAKALSRLGSPSPQRRAKGVAFFQAAARGSVDAGALDLDPASGAEAFGIVGLARAALDAAEGRGSGRPAPALGAALPPPELLDNLALACRVLGRVPANARLLGAAGASEALARALRAEGTAAGAPSPRACALLAALAVLLPRSVGPDRSRAAAVEGLAPVLAAALERAPPGSGARLAAAETVAALRGELPSQPRLAAELLRAGAPGLLARELAANLAAPGPRGAPGVAASLARSTAFPGGAYGDPGRGGAVAGARAARAAAQALRVLAGDAAASAALAADPAAARALLAGAGNPDAAISAPSLAALAEAAAAGSGAPAGPLSAAPALCARLAADETAPPAARRAAAAAFERLAAGQGGEDILERIAAAEDEAGGGYEGESDEGGEGSDGAHRPRLAATAAVPLAPPPVPASFSLPPPAHVARPADPAGAPASPRSAARAADSPRSAAGAPASPRASARTIAVPASSPADAPSTPATSSSPRAGPARVAVAASRIRQLDGGASGRVVRAGGGGSPSAGSSPTSASLLDDEQPCDALAPEPEPPHPAPPVPERSSLSASSAPYAGLELHFSAVAPVPGVVLRRQHAGSGGGLPGSLPRARATEGKPPALPPSATPSLPPSDPPSPIAAAPLVPPSSSDTSGGRGASSPGPRPSRVRAAALVVATARSRDPGIRAGGVRGLWRVLASPAALAPVAEAGGLEVLLEAVAAARPGRQPGAAPGAALAAASTASVARRALGRAAGHPGGREAIRAAAAPLLLEDEPWVSALLGARAPPARAGA